MKYAVRLLLCAILTMALGAACLSQAPASADAFNQNNLIDEAVFDNTRTMTAAQIDSWLNTNFGARSCISTDHGFSAPDPTGYNTNQGFIYGNNVSAGQVIYDASQTYSINPEVLLTTIQKEQGLVDGSGPYGCGANAYAAAAGYGCPDSGGSYNYSGGSTDLGSLNGQVIATVSNTCVNTSAKIGFSQQIIRAAWLLKFGEQRAEGNIGWDVQLTNQPESGDSWNNSDDPQSCYSGPMVQGTWQICPGGPLTYYDGLDTIDSTSVQMDNGATAALYWYTPHFNGNENFDTIFTNWFGNTHVPEAFVTPSSGTVYLQTDGYKFTVPSMAMLQDFGISPGSIQQMSQAAANNIPFADPSTGLSTGLGYVVKSPSDTDADGPTVYLISAGHRYEVQNMTQFTNFGFSTSTINYLPLAYIYSIPDGGALSNFIETPTSNVFEVSGGNKNIIFDPAYYASLNSGGSASYVSTAMAATVPSGNPLTNREILVGQTNSTVYLFDNGTYYSLPSMDVYNCWGFNGPLETPLYQLADGSYIGSVGTPSSLSCAVNTNVSTTYLLNSTNKVSVPASTGFTAPVVDSNLLTLVNKLPARSNPLGQVIKASGQPTAWVVQNGNKATIPSITDFNLLGLSSSSVDSIASGAASAIPTSGIELGVGNVVKTTSSGTVYVVVPDNKLIAFASGDDFTAYGYNWPAIETFPSATLTQSYTIETGTTISKYLYDAPSNSVYLMDANGCYSMSPSLLTAYGQTQSTLESSQSYTSSNFPNLHLSSCKPASLFVKAPNQGVVYWVTNGQIDPISSWSKLQSLSQQNQPYIITLSPSTLATFAYGPTQ